MRRWVLLGAIAGLIGGGASALLEGLLHGEFRLGHIGVEGGLAGVSLAFGAAAAYVPSNWVGRGLAGGFTYGVVQGGLQILFSLSDTAWPHVLGGEVVGGVIGGCILAYLWRPDRESGSV